jgi:hypothetical protein
MKKEELKEFWNEVKAESKEDRFFVFKLFLEIIVGLLLALCDYIINGRDDYISITIYNVDKRKLKKFAVLTDNEGKKNESLRGDYQISNVGSGWDLDEIRYKVQFNGLSSTKDVRKVLKIARFL